jgi:hypothetical protein
MSLLEPREPIGPTVPELLCFLTAYAYLLEACKDAKEQGREPPEMPLDYPRLGEVGAGADALQWMLFQGHVDHLEVGAEGWVPRPSAVADRRSAFALTPRGEAFAEALLCLMLLPLDNDEFDWACAQPRVGVLTPRYDAERRLLSWGRQALKSYRQPSGNQETILLAAEELAWAPWFDDPLPRVRRGNPKSRLHDAIKNLNRHQRVHVVHFKGDGTGTKVGWELQ